MVAAPAVARVVGLVQWTDLTTAPPWASGKICFRSAVADKRQTAPPGAMKIGTRKIFGRQKLDVYLE